MCRGFTSLSLLGVAVSMSSRATLVELPSRPMLVLACRGGQPAGLRLNCCARKKAGSGGSGAYQLRTRRLIQRVYGARTSPSVQFKASMSARERRATAARVDGRTARAPRKPARGRRGGRSCAPARRVGDSRAASGASSTHERTTLPASHACVPHFRAASTNAWTFPSGVGCKTPCPSSGRACPARRRPRCTL